MVRKLKYHEQKLLKKVDFISWKVDNYGKENKALRKFHIRKRQELTTYNKLAREIRELVEKISKLDKSDSFKAEATNMLLGKLYALGVGSDTVSLENASKIHGTHFCRRRLPVIMVKSKMCENLKNATDLIEQGHVRVGPDMIKDPAFIVSRNLEDFVTWVDGSKIKEHVMNYNNLRDDFEL